MKIFVIIQRIVNVNTNNNKILNDHLKTLKRLFVCNFADGVLITL